MLQKLFEGKDLTFQFDLDPKMEEMGRTIGTGTSELYIQYHFVPCLWTQPPDLQVVQMSGCKCRSPVGCYITPDKGEAIAPSADPDPDW